MIRFSDVAPTRETKTSVAGVIETKTPMAKNKGGRPKRVTQPPWVVAGIPRATWYRQQRAKAS